MQNHLRGTCDVYHAASKISTVKYLIAVEPSGKGNISPSEAGLYYSHFESGSTLTLHFENGQKANFYITEPNLSDIRLIGAMHE